MTQGVGVELLDRIEIIDASECAPTRHAKAESLELSVSFRRFWALAVVIGLAAVILLTSNRQPEQAVPTVPSTIGTGELSGPSKSTRFEPGTIVAASPDSTTPAGNVRWPVPPANRDPSYLGRPGSGDPVRSDLVDKTLLYVNDFGRPTIVDLTTGDQREVLIADSHSQGSFELEFGQIVTTDTERSDLPLSIGRSIGVMGKRAGSVIEDNDEYSIVLCIDGPGCSGETILLIPNPAVLDSAALLDTSNGVEAAIAQLLRAEVWSTDHRWTLFAMDSDDEDQSFKIPTARPEAVVWLISQSP